MRHDETRTLSRGRAGSISRPLSRRSPLFLSTDSPSAAFRFSVCSSISPKLRIHSTPRPPPAHPQPRHSHAAWKHSRASVDIFACVRTPRLQHFEGEHTVPKVEKRSGGQVAVRARDGVVAARERGSGVVVVRAAPSTERRRLGRAARRRSMWSATTGARRRRCSCQPPRPPR